MGRSSDATSILNKRAALVSTIFFCSSAGTSASDDSIAFRECGYVEVGCGKSYSHMMLSTPIMCRSAIPLTSNQKFT